MRKSLLSARVLHILDSDLDSQSWRTAEDLLRAAGKEIHIERRIIGRRGDDRGIAEAFFRLRGVGREFDLVHTFGRRALIAAAFACKGPMVHTLAPEANDSEIRWLRAIRSYRPMRVVCSGDWDMRRIVRDGVDIGGCNLIHPGVDFSRIRPRRDPKWRAQLGFTENDYVILASGESTPLARHDLSLWTCGILSELSENYRMLLWGRGKRARRLAERSRPWRRANMAVFAEFALQRPVKYEELLSAADVVLVTGDNGIATQPIALAMAAGLAIISVTNRSTSELLEDRHTAVMVGTEKPRELARRILDLRSDTALQWHIADRARAEAYEHFSLSKAMQQWWEIYAEMNVAAPATLANPSFS